MRIYKMSVMVIALAFLLTSANVHASDGEEDDYSFSSSSGDSGTYHNTPQQVWGDDDTATFSHEEYRDPPQYRYSNREIYRDQEPDRTPRYSSSREDGEYFTPYMPSQIKPVGEKVIIVNPNSHAWGAYLADGKLVKSGLATAGSEWCEDLGRPCKTGAGVFRIQSLGDEECVSKRFPLGEGGAPMPYCMYFSGGQALHGSNEVAAANLSHGCVRLHVADARWIRFHFAAVGTKVMIVPY